MGEEVAVGWWMDATALQVAVQKPKAGWSVHSAGSATAAKVTECLLSKLCPLRQRGTTPEWRRPMDACVRAPVDGDRDCLLGWMLDGCGRCRRPPPSEELSSISLLALAAGEPEPTPVLIKATP